MAAVTEFEPGSYRDRDARVFRDAQGRVCRALSAYARGEWKAVRNKPFFLRAMEQGNIVASETAYEIPVPVEDAPDQWVGTLRHESIPFVSYPFEWSFGMLQDAALLQLELLAVAISEGFTLKDGTAYNVQWNGAQPVFIDIASFERHEGGRPWAGYRQFCQTCLFPLILQAYRHVSFQPLLRGCLEGITARECARMLSWRDCLRPWVFTHVWLHARLEEWAAAARRNVARDLPAAGFDASMIRRNALNLANHVRALRWSPAPSVWTDYSTDNSYSADDARQKEAFVRKAVASQRWKLAWDLGANTGTFARIARTNAEYVVAMDAEHAVVERLYQSLKSDSTKGAAPILPLVVNLADASPGLGWRGKERLPLVDRGQPDLVLCLALIHHLVFGAGIPLRELFDWLASLKASLVIEYVDRSDPMVVQLLRGRRDNYGDYRKDAFEKHLTELFDVVTSEPLQCGTRQLYFARPRV